MSNVSNPSGPVNPVNPDKSTEPVRPGTDKFKDLMKIDANAEKQKKNKKRSQESLEEKKAKLQAGPAEPDRHLITRRTEKYPKIQKIGQSEKRQTKHSKRSEETATELAREEAAALAQKKSVQSLEIPSTSGAPSEEEIANATAAASQAQKDLEHILEEEKESIKKEEVAQNYKQAAAKKEENKPQASAVTTTLGPLFLAPAPNAAPAYSLLDAQTLALFEKMVSVLSILKESGVTETTIHLGSEFANSQYAGAQIIIREYSTAPLTYNIEFLGNPLAAEAFRKNLGTLRSALDDPKFRFRIHRLESSISKEPFPRVERKEESEEK
jgi:hypothetical protein